jgi:hypothetical protein
VVVSRPSRWGNPHHIGPELTRAAAVQRFRDDLVAGRLAFTTSDVQRELAGKDLACWCPLDEPCHADVLLDVASGHGIAG